MIRATRIKQPLYQELSYVTFVMTKWPPLRDVMYVIGNNASLCERKIVGQLFRLFVGPETDRFVARRQYHTK